MKWINVKDKPPMEGQSVIYYFKPVGIHIGKYKRIEVPEEFIGTKGIYEDYFYGKSGYLCGDVTHWMDLSELPD